MRPGSYAPLVTPLREDRSLDEEALDRLVEHVLGGGCAGVLALGSAGENVAVGKSMRHRVMACVVDAVGVRADVMVGIAQPGLREAIEEAEAAAAAGARAVVVTPPYYGPLDGAGVERFYTALAERCPLPLLAYHIPAFTGVPVPSVVVGRLAAAGVLAGVKDSGRDLEYFQQVLAAVSGSPEVSVLTGTDSLILAALALGGSGAVSIAANVVPGWTTSLYDAVVTGEIERARELQRRLSRVAFALRTGIFPAGAKSALAMLGICGPTTAEPGRPLDGDGWRDLAGVLVAEGVVTEPVRSWSSAERRPV